MEGDKGSSLCRSSVRLTSGVTGSTLGHHHPSTYAYCPPIVTAVGAGVLAAGVVGAGVVGAGVLAAGVGTAGVVGAGVLATGVVAAAVDGAGVLAAGVEVAAAATPSAGHALFNTWLQPFRQWE